MFAIPASCCPLEVSARSRQSTSAPLFVVRTSTRFVESAASCSSTCFTRGVTKPLTASQFCQKHLHAWPIRCKQRCLPTVCIFCGALRAAVKNHSVLFLAFFLTIFVLGLAAGVAFNNQCSSTAVASSTPGASDLAPALASTDRCSSSDPVCCALQL